MTCLRKIFLFSLIVEVFSITSSCQSGTMEEDIYSTRRAYMVKSQIEARGVDDARVLAAMRKVPRHLFVPEEYQDRAYNDCPLLIGYEQTISQPYIVAYMTEALELDSDSKVLEIGTGSGYQAAILAEICKEVYSIEIVEPLAKRAKTLLDSLFYKNLHLKQGDGYKGWAQYAPFDAIIVTCAPSHIPQPLKDQLAEGGRLIIPYGAHGVQQLVLLRKMDGKVKKQSVLPVRFVPMTDEKGEEY